MTDIWDRLGALLRVTEWPRRWRRVFVVTLPVSGSLWIVTATAVLVALVAVSIAEGITREIDRRFWN